MRASQALFAAMQDECPTASEIHSRYTHLSAEAVREAHKAGSEMRKRKKINKQGELF